MILGRRWNFSIHAVVGALVHAGRHAGDHAHAPGRHAFGVQIWGSVTAGVAATTGTGVAAATSGTRTHFTGTTGIGVALAVTSAALEAIAVELERGVAAARLGLSLGLAPRAANREAVVSAIQWWCRCRLWLWLLRRRRMEQHEAHGNGQGPLDSGSSRSHGTSELPSL